MSDQHHAPGYDPQAVEAKWEARWAERHTNEPDLDGAVRPFYNLMMFPYPSAEGLHVGNMFAFTGSDTYGRFKRLQGHDVFQPIGFDAFGIHSENYAIKLGIHPAELIPRNIANFRRQLVRIGGMFDWRNELATTDPAYYKWTQWLFLQLFKAGKAYRKYGMVNWCPECKTVLANEQVINGFCERHPDTRVEQRALEQWYFRITEYADRLLANLDDRTAMDWSASTATAQRNWLGRSEGAEIEFDVEGDCGAIRVFTTRPDTLFGATFMVLAPEHPLVAQLTDDAHRAAVDAYRQAAAAKDLVSRRIGDRDKTGTFTGAFAVNPATGQRIPVWSGLRADGIRDRRHHGRPRPRRARLRVRHEIRAAGRARARAHGNRFRRPRHGGRKRHRGVRAGQLGPLQRPAGHGRQDGNHPVARGRGPREGRRPLQNPRLVHFAAAVLGPAHPHHLLRRVRPGAGAREGPAGVAPADRGLPPRRQRGVAARAPRVVLRRAPTAASGRGAKPTSPTPSSTRRGTTSATRAPNSPIGRSTRRAPGNGARSRCTSAATNTPCSTCFTRGSSRWRSTTSATWSSTNHSRGSRPTASS
jgi:hypothetical protein